MYKYGDRLPMRGGAMMERSGDWMHNPLFVLYGLVHLVAMVLFVLILLFVTMWLWEKVKTARYHNEDLRKKRK